MVAAGRTVPASCGAAPPEGKYPNRAEVEVAEEGWHGRRGKTAVCSSRHDDPHLWLSLGLPVEDVLETTYDESEAVPFEGTPLFSIAAPTVTARTTQDVQSFLRLDPVASSPFAPVRAHDTDTNRSAEARPSLVLLCTLLC